MHKFKKNSACIYFDVFLFCFFNLEVEAEPAREPGERPSKRRCFWEYRRARETTTKKKLGGDVHWSLSWSSSTLPSTLYRREGETTAEHHQHSAETTKRSLHLFRVTDLVKITLLSHSSWLLVKSHSNNVNAAAEGVPFLFSHVTLSRLVRYIQLLCQRLKVQHFPDEGILHQAYLEPCSCQVVCVLQQHPI